MIVVHGINRGKEESKCQPCLYEESSSQISEIGNLINERNRLGFDSYKDITFTCFKNHRSIRLNERLINLARNYDGEIFLNEIHRSRFKTIHIPIPPLSVHSVTPSSSAVFRDQFS